MNKAPSCQERGRQFKSPPQLLSNHIADTDRYKIYKQAKANNLDSFLLLKIYL